MNAIETIVITNACETCAGENRSPENYCGDFQVVTNPSPWYGVMDGALCARDLRKSGLALSYQIDSYAERPEEKPNQKVYAVLEDGQIETLAERPCGTWRERIKDRLWSKGIRFITITALPPEVPK